MQKILIFENEELFKILQQVKDLFSSYEFIHASEIEPSVFEAPIIIANVAHLQKLKSGGAHIILLAGKDEENKPKKNTIGITLVRKPYSLKEIIEVLQSVIVASSECYNVIKIGGFEFIPSNRVLLKNGIKINLTEKESELVTLLNNFSGDIVNRDEILKQVWGYENGVDTHTVETHIYRIRQKLGKENDFIGSSASGYFIKQPEKA